jgi:hypothetical protein
MLQAYSSLGTQWLMRGHRYNPVLWDAVVEVGMLSRSLHVLGRHVASMIHMGCASLLCR